MSTRLQEIEEIVRLAPSDPFPLYGLAMEHRNLGQHQDAHQQFALLHERFPDYVPGYLMHGQLLLDNLRDLATARAVVQAGIERAERTRNGHAKGELSSLLQRIEDAADAE